MRPPKRDGGVLPSPVNLAEWVNEGFCPLEALHEAGRLFIDLTEIAPLRVKIGTDVQLDENKHYSPALGRVDVNADSIIFRWREKKLNSNPLAGNDATSEIEEENKLLAGNDATSERKEEIKRLAENLNSVPMASRVLREHWDENLKPVPIASRVKHKKRIRSLAELVDLWNDTPETIDFFRNPGVRALVESLDKLPPLYRHKVSSLAELVDLWNDTPETMRPAHFPLDPVVGEMVGSRVSLGDYLPTFRCYQEDVRRALERDKVLNGQDARNVILESRSPDREKHDVLIGLLRAGADPHVEKLVREGIEKLIPKLATLDDVNHVRVEKALEYAIGSERSNSKNWRRSYDKARRDATKRAGG